MNFDNKDAVECHSQCLTGRCPFKKCIKYKSRAVIFDINNLKMQILEKSFGVDLYSHKKGLGIAFDLGTTTIAGALYDMTNTRELAVVTGVNNQVVFGRDVISRIKYCAENKDGVLQERDAVIEQLNEMIAVLCCEASVDIKSVNIICISGNTTMLHLLCGLSPVSMGTYPFEPKSLFGYETNAKDLGLISEARCYLPPAVSAFVGADVVCGLTALNFVDKNGASFMDIGTNGEVAAVSERVIFTSATAAGPAFEGAHITCGMAAAPGAVSHIKLKDGRPAAETIDGAEPKGLTGSGLTDAVAVFVKLGEIEKNGKIATSAAHYALIDGEAALRICGDVFITQKDIREFQTAKAAMCAGVITLIQNLKKNQETGEPKNETLFLAGGFGNYINVDNARYIGLMPKNFNTMSVGNTSLAGAALIMMNDELRATARNIAENANVIDLSTDPLFMDNYVECMRLTEF